MSGLEAQYRALAARSNEIKLIIEKWLLRRLCSRLVIQGPQHKRNITEYYKAMAEAARKEFSEDNKITLDSFLAECHQDSLGTPAMIQSPTHRGIE